MNPPRVVLDTNVVVSAALHIGGLEAQVIELIAARVLSLYICGSPKLDRAVG
jgi:predicted nucleic acid-binding protein